MPSTTPEQARFMAACAHGADYASCPPSKVSTEFNQADKGTAMLSRAMRERSAERRVHKQFGGAMAPGIGAMGTALRQPPAGGPGTPGYFGNTLDPRSPMAQPGYQPPQGSAPNLASMLAALRAGGAGTLGSAGGLFGGGGGGGFVPTPNNPAPGMMTGLATPPGGWQTHWQPGTGGAPGSWAPGAPGAGGAGPIGPPASSGLGSLMGGGAGRMPPAGGAGQMSPQFLQGLMSRAGGPGMMGGAGGPPPPTGSPNPVAANPPGATGTPGTPAQPPPGGVGGIGGALAGLGPSLGGFRGGAPTPGGPQPRQFGDEAFFGQLARNNPMMNAPPNMPTYGGPMNRFAMMARGGRPMLAPPGIPPMSPTGGPMGSPLPLARPPSPLTSLMGQGMAARHAGFPGPRKPRIPLPGQLRNINQMINRTRGLGPV